MRATSSAHTRSCDGLMVLHQPMMMASASSHGASTIQCLCHQHSANVPMQNTAHTPTANLRARTVAGN